MSVTFELQIRFVSESDDALRLKRQVLSWLRREGFDQVVESLIDGIEIPLATYGTPEDYDECSVSFKPSFDPQDDTAPIAVYDQDERVLVALGRRLRQKFAAGIELVQTAITDESWSMAWDEDTDVIRTERFVVLAPGAENPDSALNTLYVHQGEAFGSGRHATTKVALEMLERLYLAPIEDRSEAAKGDNKLSVRDPQMSRRDPLGTERMLDVGTGNGILLLAGAKLGFRSLSGTEIDQDVLDEAQENLTLNQVEARLLMTPKPPEEPGVLYDLVTANILAPVLHDLMPIFASSLAPHGVLLLAGFVAKEEPGIVEAAKKNGLIVRMRGECRGWVGLVLQR
jgi:ribosomal protein L11 methylase PrmA